MSSTPTADFFYLTARILCSVTQMFDFFCRRDFRVICCSWNCFSRLMRSAMGFSEMATSIWIQFSEFGHADGQRRTSTNFTFSISNCSIVSFSAAINVFALFANGSNPNLFRSMRPNDFGWAQKSR